MQKNCVIIFFSSGRRVASKNNSTSTAFVDKNQIKLQQTVLQKVQKNTDQPARLHIPPQMRGWTEQQRRRLYRIGLNFFNKFVFYKFFNRFFVNF